MKLNETTLPFLEVDCIQQFGQEKGKLIFEQAEKIYQELLNNADYRNNAAIQNHLQLKLFPTLAYYKALRGEGINQNEALEYVRNETHKAANVQKEEMKKLGSMPFAYTIYCNGVQREHNKKLNNGLPILHKVPPKRDYGRYFCIMAEKGGTSHGGLTEKLSLFFHAKKQEVNAYGR